MFIWVYLLFVAAVAIVAAVAVWFAPKWRKLLSFVLFLGLLVGTPIVYFETLARPKQLEDEMLRNDKKVRVIAYYVEDGVAVYYLLMLPSASEPRYYYEPWSEGAKDRAQSLQDGAENGEQMVMMLPFDRSWDDSKKVHPLPRTKLPEKYMTEPKAPPPREYGA